MVATMKHAKTANAGNWELDVVGNADLLAKPTIGICGSRNASPNGLRYAGDFARMAVQLGFVVASGYAKGVDTQAHRGAMAAGGETIAVLAEGIDYFRIRRDLRELDPEQRLLAVSQFEPSDVWTTGRAMARNKVIVALSKGLVVVEAGETGGTVAAGRECLKQGKPLFVIAYEARKLPGNGILIQEGGIPVKRPRELREYLVQLKGPV